MHRIATAGYLIPGNETHLIASLGYVSSAVVPPRFNEAADRLDLRYERAKYQGSGVHMREPGTGVNRYRRTH